MIGIYSITNKINGKRYIGQSRNIETRWRREKGHYPVLNEHLLRSFRKYGLENFAFDVICECRDFELSELEKFIISELQTHDPEIWYNKTFGGEGCKPTIETRRKMSERAKGRIISEEARKKISAHHKGRKKSLETRRRMSEGQKGRYVSEETRQKLAACARGRIATVETRKKLSEIFKGRIHSPEARRKMSESAKRLIRPKASAETRQKMSEGRRGGTHPNARPVGQYTRAGEFLREFACTSDADRFFGVARSNISSAALGKRKTAFGYVWKYMPESYR